MVVQENSKIMIKYRVKWWYKDDPNKTYHGKLNSNRQLINEWVKWSNKKYPELKHIVEEVNVSGNHKTDTEDIMA